MLRRNDSNWRALVRMVIRSVWPAETVGVEGTVLLAVRGSCDSNTFRTLEISCLST